MYTRSYCITCHSICCEYLIVDGIGRHVPVGLRSMNLHGQHGLRERSQLGVAGSEAVQVAAEVGVHGLINTI